ncbi:MAG TPA: hypothetical protein VM266_08425 [Solirubrobacteraceae bacterium]|nr:hypothetical protein [Solirubrobacteraceae bacterium]
MTQRTLAEPTAAAAGRAAPQPAPAGTRTPAAAALGLQRTIGNAAAAQVLQRCGAGGCSCGGSCGGAAGALEDEEALLRAPLALSRAVAARRGAPN